jgi:hypothetical protein
MRVFMRTDWAIGGQHTIPAGTFLHGDPWPFWRGQPVPNPLPITAQAMDTAAERTKRRYQ